MPGGFFIVALAVPVLDLVGGVPAAAGDFLDEGSGVGGQLGPIVQDAELVVIDRHDDDLAAVACPTWSLAPATMSRPWLETTQAILPSTCMPLRADSECCDKFLYGFKGALSAPRA